MLRNLLVYSFVFGVAYQVFKKLRQPVKVVKIIDLDIPEWVNSGPRNPVEELNYFLVDAVDARLSRVESIKQSEMPDLIEDIVLIARAYGDGRMRVENNNSY